MANPAVPFGFRVAAPYGSSMPNYALNVANIAYNQSNKIAFGDPVIMNSSGQIDIYTNGGSSIFGIFAGCEYTNPTAIGGVTFSQYWPAPSGLASTTIVTARVITDPTMTFMAQVDGAAMVQTNIGNNIDITAATSGVPNTAGISTCSLSSASSAASALPFRIVGVVGLGDILATGPIGPIPSYDYTANLNFVYVKLNTSILNNTSGV